MISYEFVLRRRQNCAMFHKKAQENNIGALRDNHVKFRVEFPPVQHSKFPFGPILFLFRIIGTKPNDITRPAPNKFLKSNSCSSSRGDSVYVFHVTTIKNAREKLGGPVYAKTNNVDHIKNATRYVQHAELTKTRRRHERKQQPQQNTADLAPAQKNS